MNNPYRLKLEDELFALRQRRIDIRHQIKRIRFGALIGGDAQDSAVLRRNLEIELRAGERRWQQLHHELGRRLPGPSVKLDVPATPPPRVVPVRRTVSTYMTKLMVPDR
jgi:hypothetical protein